MNIKMLLIIGLISLFNLNCTDAQTQDTLGISADTINDKIAMEAKTVFEKQLNDHVCVRQVLTSDENSDYLTLFFCNSRLIKRLKIGELIFESSKSVARFGTGLGIMPPALCSKLLDAILLENNLFIVETNCGKLVFTHILFHDDYEFDVKYKNVFDSIKVVPSVSNGGCYICDFKYYAGDLFYSVHASDFGSKLEGVYCYKIPCNSLFKLEFPLKSNARRNGSNVFRTLNFDESQNVPIISEVIEKVLKASINYLWAFDSDNYSYGTRTSGITYFFYRKDDDTGKVKVIRYDNYNEIWLLDDYKEERISGDTKKN